MYSAAAAATVVVCRQACHAPTPLFHDPKSKTAVATTSNKAKRQLQQYDHGLGSDRNPNHPSSLGWAHGNECSCIAASVSCSSADHTPRPTGGVHIRKACHVVPTCNAAPRKSHTVEHNSSLCRKAHNNPCTVQPMYSEKQRLLLHAFVTLCPFTSCSSIHKLFRWPM